MATPAIEELNLLHDHICKALAEPKRIQLLYALHEEPRNVSALAEALELPQPTVSRHLNLLRQSLMVTSERSGTSITYRLADPRIITVLDTMRQIVREAVGRRSSVLE